MVSVSEESSESLSLNKIFEIANLYVLRQYLSQYGIRSESIWKNLKKSKFCDSFFCDWSESIWKNLNFGIPSGYSQIQQAESIQSLVERCYRAGSRGDVREDWTTPYPNASTHSRKRIIREYGNGGFRCRRCLDCCERSRRIPIVVAVFYVLWLIRLNQFSTRNDGNSRIAFTNDETMLRQRPKIIE